MSTGKTWPSGQVNAVPVNYDIPAIGDLNWGSLSNFLLALADGAQSTTFQRFSLNVVTSTPYTTVEADCVIIVQLDAPAAVAVNLEALSAKKVLFIKDGTGDAATNNITITPDGAQTIDGNPNVVLSDDNAYIMLIADVDNDQWRTVIKGNYT